MKLVVQRVKNASVSENKTGKIAGSIQSGLLVLMGVGKTDTTKEADILVRKLINLRVMSDDKDKMNLAIKESGGALLIVSQFTLYANTKGGNRPSFIEAAEPEKANDLYTYFLEQLKKEGVKVESGSFGNYMQINAELDGPVTILFEA